MSASSQPDAHDPGASVSRRVVLAGGAAVGAAVAGVATAAPASASASVSVFSS